MISISSFMSSSIQRDVHILDDGQQNILQGVTTLWLTHFRPNMLNSGPKAEDGETQAFRAGVHCTRPRNNPANNLVQKTDVVVFTVWFFKKMKSKMLIITFELGFPFTPLPTRYVKLR